MLAAYFANEQITAARPSFSGQPAGRLEIRGVDRPERLGGHSLRAAVQRLADHGVSRHGRDGTRRVGRAAMSVGKNTASRKDSHAARDGIWSDKLQ